MDKEKIKNFITTQRASGIPDAEIYSFLKSKGVDLTQSQPKPDGFLKTIGKDVAETLLVKPADRFAEAVGRTGILGEDIKKGYETMSEEGQSRQFNVPGLGGIDVEAQKGGAEGNRQIVSDTLKTASYLFPYGKAGKLAGNVLGKVGGNIASGATGGYLADVGYNLADEDKTVSESLTPGLGTALGAAIPATGATLRGTGRLLKKTGEKTVDVVIPASTREAQLLQTYKANNPFLKRVGDVLKGVDKTPQTAGKTVLQKGLMGTKSGIGVQAKRASDKLWNDLISPRLKASEQAVDLDGFFSKIQDDIIKSTDDITRQKSLLEGLQAVKDDYAGINNISLEKLQKLKESWAKFLPSKAYKGQEIGGAVNEVRRLLSKEARQTIYSTLGDDVKMAYLDYGNLQGLKEMGVSSMTGQKLKGGAGSFLSEAFNQVVTPIGTIGGQGIYQVGKGIEFIGNLGAKNLGQALGINLKFPGDAFLDTKTGKKVINYAKNPKVGMSIEDVSEKSLKNQWLTNDELKMSTKELIKKAESLAKEAEKNKDNFRLFQSKNGEASRIYRYLELEKSSLKGKGTIPQNSELDRVDKFGLTPVIKDDIVAIIDDYRLNKGKKLELQEDAARIAEDLGIKMPKTYGALVKKLEDLLVKSDNLNG